MTTLARNQSDRVSGLVYLDALGDLEDDPSADPEWLALLKKVPTELRPQPVCDPVDTSTFAAYQRSLACRLGFVIPESELRNQAEDITGSVGLAKSPEGMARDWPVASASGTALVVASKLVATHRLNAMDAVAQGTLRTLLFVPFERQALRFERRQLLDRLP